MLQNGDNPQEIAQLGLASTLAENIVPSPIDYLQASTSETSEPGSDPSSGDDKLDAVSAESLELDGTGVLPTETPLPNLTSLQNPVAPFQMDSGWTQPGTFTYYTPEHMKSGERQSISPQNSMHSYDDMSHRRATTLPHGSSYLPPPSASAPHTIHSGGNLNLPPLGQTGYFYGHSQSSTGNIHPMNPNLGYSPHLSVSNSTSGGFLNPMTSPMGMPDGISPNSGHRVPPPHAYQESPRIPGYSSSPGGHHLSPTSPANHILHGMNQSSASASSSSFPSVQRTPANLPRGAKRRSTSASHSSNSWDEMDKYMPSSTEVGTRELGDDQPWGMPQSEYKALTPRDKKQVRNRIGARRFRAKRKDYVSNLEVQLRTRDDELATMKARVDAQQVEINQLRARLNLPPIEMVHNQMDSSSLGLVMNHTNGDSSASNTINGGSSTTA
ncbi:uncharacterized protein I303_106221 [Kwoniella dejecticola CBS 10117]|uniref:BZIP domain-containing protein n=1 Tax=Kwoniella dejecticola CBS 10117 TaxID=1296121 RepID=A0A1A6A1L9_9TREE|nr:uncharacterized protein I303_06240 [Kwoniella dejecticola CBS 10117]OBR83953.1 hypothetical protein I303_06240 [Kwoniella dejecticola CBS 10117]